MGINQGTISKYIKTLEDHIKKGDYEQAEKIMKYIKKN